MSAEREVTPPPHVLQLLDPDEELRHQAPAKDLVLVLTDRRLVVADDDRVTLDIPYPRLRRVQLDVERSRPATLVLVPESPEDEPQVLAIPHADLERAASAVAMIGRRLDDG